MSVVRMVLDLERIGDDPSSSPAGHVSDKPIPSIVEKDLPGAVCPTRAPCSAIPARLPERRRPQRPLAVSRYDDETAQMMVNIFQKLMQAVGDHA